jgi:hypothetical protein
VVRTAKRPGLIKQRQRENASRVELSRPEGLPERVGPFLVRGALSWLDDLSILEGEDSALKRSAWIVCRPTSAPAWPAARHSVDRLTRLRWLGGGVDSCGRWEAVIAPTGRPLSECVSRRSPLPWREARPILHALAEELAAACAEGTLPDLLTLDQVWLRPDGQVLLLDVPRNPSIESPEPNPGLMTPEQRALGLLRAAAVVMLEGKARPLDQPRHVRAVMPRSASAVFDRLMAEPPRAPSLHQFVDEMRRIEEERAELGAGQQFVWTLAFVLATWSELVVPIVLLIALITGIWRHPEAVAAIDWDALWAALPLGRLYSGEALALILWAFFSRGGLLRSLLEADYVRRDGRPASRLRCAWREAMFWGPFLGLAPISGKVGSITGVPEEIIGLAFLFGPPLLYAAHGLFFPGRMLQDRLAGTVLVPK